MKFELKETPRTYKVGLENQITIKDMGTISLESDEQVTFITPGEGEYDLCRKSWGYYATPSVNDRLKRFGFKTAVVRNSKGQVYIMIVEISKMTAFQDYLAEECNEVIQWLDEEPLVREL
jgi:hypothetical protein